MSEDPTLRMVSLSLDELQWLVGLVAKRREFARHLAALRSMFGDAPPRPHSIDPPAEIARCESVLEALEARVCEVSP